MARSTQSNEGPDLGSRALSRWKGRRSRLVGAGMTLALSSVVLGIGANPPLAQAANRSFSVVTAKAGELDCNGNSPIQHPDQGDDLHRHPRVLERRQRQHLGRPLLRQRRYIGHDEPDMTFLSTRPGPATT